MRTTLMILLLIPFGSRTQQNTGFEFHASVNRPFGHSETNTYYGGGIGANVIFRDTSVFNFKTGLEVNYFHTWDDHIFAGKMSHNKDWHYRYAVVSIPAFARLTFGKRVKFFLEAGAYLGFCAAGKVRYTDVDYGMYPGQPSYTYQVNDWYKPGLFVIPSVGLGLSFPIAERLDLFVKPEFAFVKNIRFSDSKTGAGYGGDYDFNYRYKYVRLCVGIHLKPKK